MMEERKELKRQVVLGYSLLCEESAVLGDDLD